MKSQALFSNKSAFLKGGLRFKAAFAGAVLMAVGGATGAHAQSPTVFKGIRIDVSGMPPGAGFARNQMQACLSRAVPAAMAGRINAGARNAQLLVVRPFTLTLADSNTNDESGGGGASDMMEGEAIIGNVRVPLLVTGASQASSPAFAEAVARQRMDALCNSFAYWLARKV
ncbi:MAG: hypothetical protein ACRCWF_16290 [Beijerinckiaceae bacterium]